MIALVVFLGVMVDVVGWPTILCVSVLATAGLAYLIIRSKAKESIPSDQKEKMEATDMSL